MSNFPGSSVNEPTSSHAQPQQTQPPPSTQPQSQPQPQSLPQLQGNLHKAVRTGRLELAATIESLTSVLEFAANVSSDNNKTPADPTSQSNPDVASTPQQQQPPDQLASQALNSFSPSQQQQKMWPSQDAQRSLEQVLTRISNLRAAANTATSLHNQVIQQAQQQLDSMSPLEKQNLEQRREALIREVHEKNKKVKLLIDHLRELYRDSLTFRNNLKVVYPAHRQSTKN